MGRNRHHVVEHAQLKRRYFLPVKIGLYLPYQLPTAFSVNQNRWIYADADEQFVQLVIFDCNDWAFVIGLKLVHKRASRDIMEGNLPFIICNGKFEDAGEIPETSVVLIIGVKIAINILDTTFSHIQDS